MHGISGSPARPTALQYRLALGASLGPSTTAVVAEISLLLPMCDTLSFAADARQFACAAGRRFPPILLLI